MTEPVTEPNHDTHFQKGQSGNPTAGRATRATASPA
jgi:hypothetical protein